MLLYRREYVWVAGTMHDITHADRGLHIVFALTNYIPCQHIYMAVQRARNCEAPWWSLQGFCTDSANDVVLYQNTGRGGHGVYVMGSMGNIGCRATWHVSTSTGPFRGMTSGVFHKTAEHRMTFASPEQ